MAPVNRVILKLLVVGVAAWVVFWVGHSVGRATATSACMVGQRAVLAMAEPPSEEARSYDQPSCEGRLQLAIDTVKQNLAIGEYILDRGPAELIFAPINEPYYFQLAEQVSNPANRANATCPAQQSVKCTCVP